MVVEGLERLHDDAVAVWKARQAIVAAELAAGASQAQADATANARSPFLHRSVRIAVLPSSLDAMRGRTTGVVTLSDQAIGHSYGNHPTTAEDWGRVQVHLDRGRVLLSDDETRAWVIDRMEPPIWLLVVILRTNEWRVLTYYRIKDRQVRKFTSIDQRGRRVIREG